MMNEHISQDSDNSEHLVAKALAAEPPIAVSALVLAIGLALSIKAAMQLRKAPSVAKQLSWMRHA